MIEEGQGCLAMDYNRAVDMIPILGAGLEQIFARYDAILTPAAAGEAPANPGWHTALDLHSLLTVAEAIARTAAERQESRGAHFRADYEGKSDEWARVSLLVRRGEGGRMEVVREPVREPPEELKQIIEENK